MRIRSGASADMPDYPPCVYGTFEAASGFAPDCFQRYAMERHGASAGSGTWRHGHSDVYSSSLADDDSAAAVAAYEHDRA